MVVARDINLDQISTSSLGQAIAFTNLCYSTLSNPGFGAQVPEHEFCWPHSSLQETELTQRLSLPDAGSQLAHVVPITSPPPTKRSSGFRSC